MNYLKVLVLGAALVVPVAVSAQNAQQNRRYEDKAHNDSHEWNNNEDQAYRRYLTENHKKYQDFAKAKQSQQNTYWNWRHSHPDEGGR
jgi:type III secretory pathway component EscR